jgi:hypothetical protein
MYLGNNTAQCSPPALAYGERHHFVALGNQMGAEYGTHTCGGTGTLELDRTVDSIGVGACQRVEAPLGCRRGQDFGTGDPDAEGEMGMGVEVGEHLY